MKSYLFLRQDLCAWCLAVVLPVIWVVLYLNFPLVIAIFIYLVVALVWVLLDRTNLMKQGITPPSWLWFPLYFVYLRQRDQIQGKSWKFLLVWLLCSVLSAVAVNQFKKASGVENLAQGACTTVTKILCDEGYDGRCIRVTDMQEEVKGRFWRAQALLNTGVKEPVTIERRGRDIYVVLPEAGE
jgi:membrane protein implicated in regulation of membrane protease activity